MLKKIYVKKQKKKQAEPKALKKSQVIEAHYEH